jgi:hypothetical protein
MVRGATFKVVTAVGKDTEKPEVIRVRGATGGALPTLGPTNVKPAS